MRYGMWPYKIRFGVTPTGTMADGYYQFRLDVNISRAWTPNYGGIPGIAEKPYSDNLDFDITVHYSVVSGDSENLKIVNGPGINVSGKLRSDKEYSGEGFFDGVPGMAGAATLVTGIGFVLSPHSAEQKFERRGRYLGKLKYAVTDEVYDRATGSMKYNYAMHIWAPDTVCDSNISYQMQTALLQVDGENLAGTSGKAVGSICCNSTDQAPFFSVWKECGKAAKGPEREEVAVPVVVE